MSDMRNIELSAAEMILLPASKHWGMILTLGILMIVLGTVGFFQPMVYTVATVVFFGALLLVAGGTGIVAAFKLRGWPGMVSAAVLAGLFLLTGLTMLMHPALSGLSLTLVIAMFLIAAGASKCWLGFTHRERQGWIWILANGAISILLGFLILGELPGAGLWVIGLFLAIELLFDGWGALALALSAREIEEQIKRHQVPG